MVKIVLKKQIKGRRFPKPFSFLSRPDRFVDKAYTVPFINGYAAISTEKIERLIQKTNTGEAFTNDDYRACLEWFCKVFGDQFTPEELAEGYPANTLIKDIFTVYLSLQTDVFEKLTMFPIPPTVM